MTGPTFVFRDAVFHNAELMANIFGLLAVDYSMKAEERRRTRKSLLTTALASKVFKECAMNSLWSIIPSLVPLLCLIPSFINLDGVYVFDDGVDDTCWTICQSYARRVREIFIERPTPVQVSRLVYFQLTRMWPPTKPFIPLLKSIRVAPGITLEPTLILLLPGPHTERIELHNNLLDDSNDAMISILSTLKRSPYLTHLTLKGCNIVTVDLSIISSYSRLRILEVNFPHMSISSTFLQSLGRLIDLEELSLHGGSIMMTARSQRFLAPNNCQPHGDTPPFNRLRCLKLIGHPRVLLGVLEHIQLSNLQMFTIEEEEIPSDSSETTLAWKTLLSQLVTMHPSHLRSIEIIQSPKRTWGHPGYSLIPDILLPLLNLPNPDNLHSFVIDKGCMSMRPKQSLAAFLKTFQNLKVLKFPLEAFQASFNLEGLIDNVVNQCRHLETLQATLHAKHIEQDLLFLQERLSSPSYFVQSPGLPHQRVKHLYLGRKLPVKLSTQPENAMKFAEFFDAAFPNLQTMVLPDGENPEWKMMEDMVLTLQRAGRRRVDSSRQQR
ncbi:hypothetical protein BJ165DRAFT_1595817, partial [Panaeolus papilionaceus]